MERTDVLTGWGKRLRKSRTTPAPSLPTIEPIETQPVDIELVPGICYFTAVQSRDGTLMFWRGGSRSTGTTVQARSRDGIAFTAPRPIIRGSHVSHNFTAFDDHGTIRGIGGQIAPGSSADDNEGLLQMTVDEEVQDKRLLMTHDHPGYVSGIERWGKATELDAHISAFFHPEGRRYYVYIRSNPAPGTRRVQFATWDGPALDGLGPFREITLIGLKDTEDIYYPCFTILDGAFVGFLPIISNEVSTIRVVRSGDGAVWEPAGDILSSKPWFNDQGVPKNNDHPAQGLIVDDDRVHLYVHRNYLGRGRGADAHLERFTFAKSDLLGR